MAFAAATPQQAELVARVILEIENNSERMKIVHRVLEQCEGKRIPAAAFRQRLRPMVTSFFPSDDPTPVETLFCLAWLWINTMNQLPSAFAQSKSAVTLRTIEELFNLCLFVPPSPSVRRYEEDDDSRPSVFSTSTTKESHMNPVEPAAKPPFETRHYVYGRDISTMTADQLIAAVKQVEQEIADLQAIKVESSFITKKVGELTDMRDKIVERLDAK